MHTPSPYTPTRQALGLAGWLLLTFAAAAAGGLASAQAGTFYQGLMRPAWAPPAWLFGPVWSVLYLLMGVAAWTVWRAARWPEVRAPLAAFVAQLVLNALWTWLFFGWRQGGWALVEIAALWVAIVVTIRLFVRVRRFAAFLLLPYLAWVSFAAVLNLRLWQLNPALLG